MTESQGRKRSDMIQEMKFLDGKKIEHYRISKIGGNIVNLSLVIQMKTMRPHHFISKPIDF